MITRKGRMIKAGGRGVQREQQSYRAILEQPLKAIYVKEAYKAANVMFKFSMQIIFCMWPVPLFELCDWILNANIPFLLVTR